MSAPAALKKFKLLLVLVCTVPILALGAVWIILLNAQKNDQGLVAAHLMDDIIAGRGLGRQDVRDDRGKALTNAQKDRLSFDVLHPALKGQRVVSEQIINYPNGTGQVKAVLEDSQGRQSTFILSTIKGPEGVIIHVSTLLRPIWEYQSNPKGEVNLSWPEKTKLRAPFVRAMAPKLEAIGINEIKAEDGEFYSPTELANVYETWE